MILRKVKAAPDCPKCGCSCSYAYVGVPYSNWRCDNRKCGWTSWEKR